MAKRKLAGDREASGHLPFRWGTGAEAYRHHHEGLATMGTPESRRDRTGGRGGTGNFGHRFGPGGEELAGLLKPTALTMMKEAEVADDPLALGRHMNQKAAYKLLGG